MVTNETLTVIKRRRSIRAYQPEQIKDEELEAVLEAGLYAPNAGDQALHFTVVQNKGLLGRLSAAAKAAGLHSGNDFLVRLASMPGYDCLYGAPTLILVSANEQSPVPLEADCCAAMENLLLAAESLDLGSCWVFFVTLAFSGPEGAFLREALSLPESYRPHYGAVIGYKRDAAPSAPPRKPNLITYVR